VDIPRIDKFNKHWYMSEKCGQQRWLILRKKTTQGEYSVEKRADILAKDMIFDKALTKNHHIYRQ